MLHQIFFLEGVLHENHVVEGQSQDHRDHLEVLLGLFETREELLEVLHFRAQKSHLVLQDILGPVE